MRSVRHWTPRYVWDRTREMRYCRRHPDHPWLTPRANEILATMLRPMDAGIEYGSGRSTRWLATRIAHLTSVEHDEDWHTDVSAALRAGGLLNVDYRLRPRDVPEDRGDESAYVRVSSEFADRSLDFALVDGAYRDFCVRSVLPKLKSGGLLVIDNANWFLPSHSRSPRSRTVAQGPAGPVWSQVQRTLSTWRTIWTCSGVWDTALYVKP